MPQKVTRITHCRVQRSMGCLLALGGVVLAIVYGNQPSVGHSKFELGPKFEAVPKFETIQGSLLWVIVFGVLSAICQAIGLITIKPVMLAGTSNSNYGAYPIIY